MSTNSYSYDDILAFRRDVEVRFPALSDNGRFEIPYGSHFWTFYRENKAALKQARVFVYKSKGQWIAEAKPIDDPENQKRAQLVKALEKWQPLLDRYPEATEIQESVMSNGVHQYLLCPKGSGYPVGSAVPFLLVEHLLKDCGYVLVSRRDVLKRRRA